MNLSKLFTITTLLLLVLSGCERDSIPTEVNLAEKDRTLRTSVCSKFKYADTIFYVRDQSDYIVAPVTAAQGTYGASPYGLQIDPSTGAINISKSETGLKYQVYYVQTGTSDTCTFDLTISGLDYPSSVHILSQNDTLLQPVYRDIANATVLKKITNVYTVESLVDNLGSLVNQLLQNVGIDINPTSAAINLKRTLKNGTLGLAPINGASRTVRLNYRIDDASKKALNHIDIKFIYYSKLSDVPVSLLNKINAQNAREGNKPAKATRAFSEDSKKPRPPEIIIVG